MPVRLSQHNLILHILICYIIYTYAKMFANLRVTKLGIVICGRDRDRPALYIDLILS